MTRVIEQLVRLRAVIALLVLVIVFGVLSPEFLTTGNLTILIKHVAINAILAIGMTFVILSGGIDLSVGSIAGLAGMIAGALISQGLVVEPLGSVIYFNAWLVVAIALTGGVLLGAVNGLLSRVSTSHRSSRRWVCCTSHAVRRSSCREARPFRISADVPISRTPVCPGSVQARSSASRPRSG